MIRISRVGPEGRMANLPNHSTAKIGYVVLAEVERFLATGQRLKELTGKDPTIIPILLLRGILLWIG